MIIIFSMMGVIIFLMFVSGPLNPSASETPTITVANAGSVDQVRWAKPFGSPENLVLSPDGKTLAVATAFKILVYDLGNLEEPLFELEGQKTPSRVMFSPDGKIKSLSIKKRCPVQSVATSEVVTKTIYTNTHAIDDLSN